MSTVSESDRQHARLEALGRVQARYSWWLVVASVFFLALHISVQDCENMPGNLRDALIPIAHGPLPSPEGGTSPAEEEEEEEDADEAESPPTCAASVLVLPVVGIPLSQVAIWAAGPAFLGLLALIFMGSLIAAAETGKALGYIDELGEMPVGFIDTVPNGIDLAFVFHPALWKGDSVWRRIASFKYQIFIVVILIQAGILWLYSLAVLRGEIVDPFLGQSILLLAGAITLLAAAGRTGYLLWRRARSSAGLSWERRLRRLAAAHAVELDRVSALGEEIRSRMAKQAMHLDDAQLEAVVAARLALEWEAGRGLRSRAERNEEAVLDVLVESVSPVADRPRESG